METTNNRLLVVEDDPNLGVILSEYLEAKGYPTTLCTNGQEGYDAFAASTYCCCILDVMMPVKDGFTLAREIRKTDKGTPIIFLTAKSMKEDTLEGFRTGGDDYITKPFSMEELLMRLQAILRRTRPDEDAAARQETFAIGQFTFDYKQQTLLQADNRQKLTSKESELLRLLCLHKGQTLERSTALKDIWEDDSYFNSRSMDVYIAKLRKYLKGDEAVEIQNVHGKGFKLIVAA
ncbi:MAG: response regulator transcription factor [Bacteroidota bacterium]